MRILRFPEKGGSRPLDPVRLWAIFTSLPPKAQRVLLELMAAVVGAEDDDALSCGAMPDPIPFSAPAREAARQRWRTLLAPRWPQLRRLLSEREARVLSLRLGLVGAPLTQERVARRLGLAVGSIAPIEKRGLAKIRAVLDQ